MAGRLLVSYMPLACATFVSLKSVKTPAIAAVRCSICLIYRTLAPAHRCAARKHPYGIAPNRCTDG